MLPMVQRTCLVTGFVIAILSFVARAQTSGLSANLVLRSQAASIAEESLSHLGDSLSTGERVGVVVDGGSARPLIENAFLDLFTRKGIHAVLQSAQGTAARLVQVTVLDQSVRYSQISGGDYRREIQTTIEARRTSRDSSAMTYLGMYTRREVDTVAFREDLGLMGPMPERERTLFDRLLGPILLIGGAFLIV